MDELIKRITEKTGISDDKARIFYQCLQHPPIR